MQQRTLVSSETSHPPAVVKACAQAKLDEEEHTTLPRGGAHHIRDEALESCSKEDEEVTKQVSRTRPGELLQGGQEGGDDDDVQDAPSLQLKEEQHLYKTYKSWCPPPLYYKFAATPLYTSFKGN